MPGIRAASAVGSVSTTKEAKCCPAASLTTVTEEGVAGRVRDHFTFTAPTFGRLNRPLPVMPQRALAVNLTDCRASRRQRVCLTPGRERRSTANESR